jgi:hypothetical protein
MPREARSSSSGASREGLEEVATELAQKVASAIAASDPGGDPPEIQVLGHEVDVAALPVGGEIDIEIKYKTNTFTLHGVLPSSDPDTEYEFDLTMKRDADQNPFGKVGFRFKHKDQWSVTVGIGEMKIGTDFTILKVDATVYKGAAPDGPAANALPA